MVKETFPAGRPLEEVVDATLNGHREVVLLATADGRVKEQCKVMVNGGSRVVSRTALYSGLVDQVCRG